MSDYDASIFERNYTRMTEYVDTVLSRLVRLGILNPSDVDYFTNIVLFRDVNIFYADDPEPIIRRLKGDIVRCVMCRYNNGFIALSHVTTERELLDAIK